VRDVIVLGWMVSLAAALIAAVLTRRGGAWTAVLTLLALAGLVTFAVVSGTN
jgi:hypothetical protein